MYKIKFGIGMPGGTRFSHMNCEDVEELEETLREIKKNSGVDITVYELVDVTKQFLKE